MTASQPDRTGAGTTLHFIEVHIFSFPKHRQVCFGQSPPSSYPLLVVGDDTAQEVGVGVPQRGHQLGERLLVQLADRAEHPLLCLEPGPSERDRPAAVSC